MQAALAPAYMLQDEMRELWEQRCATIAEDEVLAELGAKTAKSQALKAMKAGDRDAARKLLKEADGDGEEMPPEPRLIVNDATVEKLGELLNENRNGLLLIRDELPGFLSRMEDQECQGERAFYLEAFNSDGSFTFDRIQRTALDWLREHGGDGALDSHGNLLAAGRWSAAKPETWASLRELGLVEFYGGNRCRVVADADDKLRRLASPGTRAEESG